MCGTTTGLDLESIEHTSAPGGLEQDGGSHNGAETEIYAGPTPPVMAALFPPRFRFPLAIFHDDVSPVTAPFPFPDVLPEGN